jgi:hypothetical protein
MGRKRREAQGGWSRHPQEQEGRGKREHLQKSREGLHQVRFSPEEDERQGRADLKENWKERMR